MNIVVPDIHGLQDLWLNEVEPHINAGDTVVSVGDFGIGYFDDPKLGTEEEFYDHIAKQGYTLLIVEGNHENFNKIFSYEETTWNGGKVHVIRRDSEGNPKIIHLMRGEYFTLDDGITLFAMGGGYTLDRSRRRLGETYFEQEMPTEKEYDNARANLAVHDNKVDFIISHTCPTSTVSYLASMQRYGITDKIIEERPLTDFLQFLSETVEYKKHYFGHFHVDNATLWRNEICMFACLRNLETGDLIYEFKL